MPLSSQRVPHWVTLFLLVPNLILAAKSAENLETYRDQIAKSQVLLLQRDRFQAAQVLIAAIKREGLKAPAYPELTKALKKTTEIFFSEKAQQSYEMALASFPTQESQTVEKLRDTLVLEPQNTLVLKALLFTLLSQRDCDKSGQAYEELNKLNPFDSDLEKLKLLTLICQNRLNEASALLEKIDSLEQQNIFWIINRQRVSKNSAISLTAETLSPSVDQPEIIYLQWLNERDRKKRLALSERYRNVCLTPISFDKAYMWMEPWACDHRNEIEEYQVKIERGN